MSIRSLPARAALVALAAALCAFGCARQESSATLEQASTDPTGTDQGNLAGGELSDANIAAIVVTYNNEEIEHAKLAQERATNAEVKQFARTMITDHNAVNQKANALATQLNLTPMESDASRKLSTDGNLFRTNLQTQSGAEFDRSYIANEVALHEQVLNQIDQQLIPQSDNADLRRLLQETRPAVEAHLMHARQIQTQLAGGTGQ